MLADDQVAAMEQPSRSVVLGAARQEYCSPDGLTADADPRNPAPALFHLTRSRPGPTIERSYSSCGFTQPGFIPFALMTVAAAGDLRYAMNTLAASGSLPFAAIPVA